MGGARGGAELTALGRGYLLADPPSTLATGTASQALNPAAGQRHLATLQSTIMALPTAVSRPALHPAFFPHIVETILAAVDDSHYHTLLQARLVCSAMTPLVDRRLAGDALLIKSHGGAEPIFISVHGVLPFFSPDSPPTMQYAVMAKARDVTIAELVHPSARLNDLLSRLSPDASVTIKHAWRTDPAFEFPAIRRLNITMEMSCTCMAYLTHIKHAARRVDLHIEGLRDYSLEPPWMLHCGMTRYLFCPRSIKTIKIWDRGASFSRELEETLNGMVDQWTFKTPSIRDITARLKERGVERFEYAHSPSVAGIWETRNFI